LLEFDVWNIKFVYKGKVLGDKEKAGGLNLKGTTVMMVLTKPKQ
jgi:vacuolar-type H+-ATPase subunit C/Vma6